MYTGFITIPQLIILNLTFSLTLKYFFSAHQIPKLTRLTKK